MLNNLMSVFAIMQRLGVKRRSQAVVQLWV